MTAPTPEQFLTQPYDPDEDLEPVAPVDPLESIAGSLMFLVDRFTADTDEEKLSGQLQQTVDDLDDERRVLTELVEEIEGIVKPSTSKLAISVREAIDRWRKPEAPATEPEAWAPGLPNGYPAYDGPVEDWRAFARSRGHQGADVDHLNRSQIRSLLGIPQVEGAAS